jgi:hypothetical protein
MGARVLSGSSIRWSFAVAGYIAGVAFGPGTEYLRIMQVAGCVAFYGYAMANARVDLVGPPLEVDPPQHASDRCSTAC